MSASNMLRIDHVTIAGQDLAALRAAFARLGLPSVYGGVHSNGITHMALLSFPDSSYIELISTCVAGQRSPWWHTHIANNGGLCAWAVQVDNVAAELERLAARGISTRGPFPMHRDRPDGVRLEWVLGYLGTGEPGAMLPFLIEDRTPCAWRVPSSAQLKGNLISGIACVVLDVQDETDAYAQMQRAWDWGQVVTFTDASFGACLSWFPGTPVILATPLARDNWLTERLRRFGDSPCALLLSTPDWATALRTYHLGNFSTWFGRRVAWFDTASLPGATRLGIIEENDHPMSSEGPKWPQQG